MRVLFISLFLFLLTSCHQKKPAILPTTQDSQIADSIDGKNSWISYFQTVKTPNGVFIKLKINNDSTYLIQWGDSLNLRTYPQRFEWDGHESRIPRFIDENKDFVVMRQSCGNPCWIGYFLPLIDSLEPRSINEYLDFDLNNNLVASIKETNIIEIVNLKSNLTEDHKTKGCVSAFLGYCLDSLSIRDKTLKYKWIPTTKINSNQGNIVIEKIKI
jgi:hypothetical protein